MIFAGKGSNKVYHSRPKRLLIQFSFSKEKMIFLSIIRRFIFTYSDRIHFIHIWIELTYIILVTRMS